MQPLYCEEELFPLDTTPSGFVPGKSRPRRSTQTAYVLALFAAGRTAVLPRFARHSWYATSIGAATAMDEYVPIKIPTTRANEKPFNTSPPNKYKQSTVRKVRPEEITVLLNVWLMLRFTRSARGSLRVNARFSRMRSKTTIV